MSQSSLSNEAFQILRLSCCFKRVTKVCLNPLLVTRHFRYIGNYKKKEDPNLVSILS